MDVVSKRFPSGVLFDSLEIDVDHGLLLVALPRQGKLSVRDVKYLGSIAHGLGLTGIQVSVGDFSTYVPVSAYVQYESGDIDQEAFIAKWRF